MLLRYVQRYTKFHYAPSSFINKLLSKQNIDQWISQCEKLEALRIQCERKMNKQEIKSQEHEL